MARNRLLYGIVLIAVTLFYGFFYGWFSEFLWYLTLLLPFVSLLVSLPAILTAKPELIAPSAVHRGEDAAAEIRLQCQFPLPRYKFRAEIIHTPSGTRKQYKFRATSSTCISYPLPANHSGAVHYFLSKSRVCDYLGLFAIVRKWELQGSTIVLPNPAQPRKLPNLTKLMSAALRPKPGGGFSEIHELREYRPGDSLRHIHWKLTAKTDRPVVREPQEYCLGAMALSLNLPTDPTDFDQVLDNTLWISAWLIERGFEHQVFWFSGNHPNNVTIAQMEDLSVLTPQLCRSQPTAPGNSAYSLTTGASWRFHVAPAGKKDGDKEVEES